MDHHVRNTTPGIISWDDNADSFGMHAYRSDKRRYGNSVEVGNSCLARYGYPDSSSGIDDGFRCCSDPRVEKQ